jgi:nicotinate-nucleotide--dimethylbenzimidazole phosphoribosyltransferase
MQTLATILAAIPAPDEGAMRRAQQHLNGLLKPVGSLGRLESLAACRIAPQVKSYLIPSHLSAEKGARIALAALGLEPYLSMEMRLGEGSGAALAMPLVDAACAIHNKMGTLAGSNIVLPPVQ